MENIKVLHLRRIRGREESLVKNLIWGGIEIFIGPCRMLIEVFIRKDFGERYFRISSAIATFTFLWIWPSIWEYLKSLVRPFTTMLAAASGHPVAPPAADENVAAMLFLPYVSWYIYLLVFLGVCIYHHLSIRRKPGVFNFNRHSRYSGDVHPFFRDFKFRGETLSPRIIECWLEPLPFFIGGIILAGFGQSLGWLLMFSAVVYALSYVEGYHHGDNYIMDVIDEMIVNKHRAADFMDELGQAKLPTTLARLPNDPAKRQAVLDRIQKDGDTIPIAD